MEHERRDQYADKTVDGMYQKGQHQAKNAAQRSDFRGRGDHTAVLRRGLPALAALLRRDGDRRAAVRFQMIRSM